MGLHSFRKILSKIGTFFMLPYVSGIHGALYVPGNDIPNLKNYEGWQGTTEANGYVKRFKLRNSKNTTKASKIHIYCSMGT